jgi:sulfite reductase alpha subunit-like flavoprotein
MKVSADAKKKSATSETAAANSRACRSPSIASPLAAAQVPQSSFLRHTPAHLHDSPVSLEVGTQISVWCPDESTYYDATIQRCSIHQRYLLKYDDDGEINWLDLSQHVFEILSTPSSSISSSTAES